VGSGREDRDEDEGSDVHEESFIRKPRGGICVNLIGLIRKDVSGNGLRFLQPRVEGEGKSVSHALM
jgi:hypothetical protein